MIYASLIYVRNMCDFWRCSSDELAVRARPGRLVVREAQPRCSCQAHSTDDHRHPGRPSATPTTFITAAGQRSDIFQPFHRIVHALARARPSLLLDHEEALWLEGKGCHACYRIRGPHGCSQPAATASTASTRCLCSGAATTATTACFGERPHVACPRGVSPSSQSPRPGAHHTEAAARLADHRLQQQQQQQQRRRRR